MISYLKLDLLILKKKTYIICNYITKYIQKMFAYLFMIRLKLIVQKY